MVRLLGVEKLLVGSGYEVVCIGCIRCGVMMMISFVRLCWNCVLWKSVFRMGILFVLGSVFSELCVLFCSSLLMVKFLLLCICMVVEVCCVVMSGRMVWLFVLVLVIVVFVGESFDIFGVILRLMWLLVIMVGVNFRLMLYFFFCSVMVGVLFELLFCVIGM